MTGERLTIEVAEGSPAVMVLSGELDLVTAGEFKRRVTGVVDGGRNDLVLDLADVAFVDSSGLGAIVGVHHYADGAGGKLVLRNASGQIRRLLEITRLDQMLNFEG